jgi:hypothetical protein
MLIGGLKRRLPKLVLEEFRELITSITALHCNTTSICMYDGCEDTAGQIWAAARAVL